MLWSGNSTGQGKDAELPNHWLVDTSAAYHHRVMRSKRGGLKRALSFLALYISTKAGLEFAQRIEGLTSFTKALTIYEQKLLEVDGDILFLVMCAFVGMVKVIETADDERRGDGRRVSWASDSN